MDLDADRNTVAVATKALSCGRKLSDLAVVLKQGEESRGRIDWHGLARDAQEVGADAETLREDLASVPAEVSSRTTLRPCLEAYLSTLNQAVASLKGQFEGLAVEGPSTSESGLDMWFRTGGLRRLEIAGITLESALWPSVGPAEKGAGPEIVPSGQAPPAPQAQG